MRISDLPITRYNEGYDYVVLDNPGKSTTKRISCIDLRFSIFSDFRFIHNQYVRGGNLGAEFTNAQKDSIRTGSFQDLWLGDYWLYNDVRWMIVDFNYFQGTAEGVKNHIVVLPDRSLSASNATTSENSAGNYCDSLMYDAAAKLKPRFASLFGDEYIMGHRDIFANTYTGSNTYPYSSDRVLVRPGIFTTLPDEIMMFGARIMAPVQAGRDAAMHITGKQFSYFKQNMGIPNPHQKFWLRDKAWHNQYVCWLDYHLAYNIWNQPAGLRPFACISGEAN